MLELLLAFGAGLGLSAGSRWLFSKQLGPVWLKRQLQKLRGKKQEKFLLRAKGALEGMPLLWTVPGILISVGALFAFPGLSVMAGVLYLAGVGLGLPDYVGRFRHRQLIRNHNGALLLARMPFAPHSVKALLQDGSSQSRDLLIDYTKYDQDFSGMVIQMLVENPSDTAAEVLEGTLRKFWQNQEQDYLKSVYTAYKKHYPERFRNLYPDLCVESQDVIRNIALEDLPEMDDTLVHTVFERADSLEVNPYRLESGNPEARKNIEIKKQVNKILKGRTLASTEWQWLSSMQDHPEIADQKPAFDRLIQAISRGSAATVQLVRYCIRPASGIAYLKELLSALSAAPEASVSQTLIRRVGKSDGPVDRELLVLLFQYAKGDQIESNLLDTVVELLGTSKGLETELIEQGLATLNVPARVQMVRVLGHRPVEQVLPFLRLLLVDANPEVKAAAVYAWGNFPDQPDFHAELLEVLRDVELISMRAALEVLAQKGTREALPKLLRYVRNPHAVRLGGENVSLETTITGITARDEILSQPLEQLFCPRHWTRPEPLTGLQPDFPWCPQCKDFEHLVGYAKTIRGVIGPVEERDAAENIFEIPFWDNEKKQVRHYKVDQLVFRPGAEMDYNWAVGAVVEHVNDHPWFLSPENQLEIRREGELELSANSQKLLNRLIR